MAFKRILIIIFFCLVPISSISAEENDSIYKERMALYKKTEAITQVPWYFLAAIDQYERQVHELPNDTVISIQYSPEEWFGIGNVNQIQDNSIVQLFNGIGKDGDGNEKADPNNPEDVLYTTAIQLLEAGSTIDDFKIALWNHYQRDLSVKTITNTAKVFKKFNDIQLIDRAFPVSITHNYSYRSTWGDRRGFGGLRIHEGTDIFANYGTPVKATTYGVIELMGWNLYGGWRIGIRDIFNIYHYYGHLNDYNDQIEVGQVVQPGDILGSVGASGYGPPGTSGKFPPHLHYGMYKDNGTSEWSFDPYPYLRKWERMEKEN